MPIVCPLFPLPGNYNEYVNYEWETTMEREGRQLRDREGWYRGRPRLTRATSSRDSGWDMVLIMIS